MVRRSLSTLAAGVLHKSAGVALPFGELLTTQFAAPAANRLTPAGVGGATVIGRYFSRRGRLLPGQAAAAVSSLVVLGGFADLLAFAALIGLGTLLGFSGASGEVPMLVNRIVGLIPVSATWWLWVAAGSAMVVGAAAWLLRHRVGAMSRRIADAVRFHRTSLGALVHQPGRLATLVSASAGTTLCLAAGFAVAATSGPTGLPASNFCALMVGYMLAAAAGNAMPTPGGIGTADAAFVGVLVAAHMPAPTALATVLVFRVVTFWAPAVLGLCMMQPLRRRGAL